MPSLRVCRSRWTIGARPTSRRRRLAAAALGALRVVDHTAVACLPVLVLLVLLLLVLLVLLVLVLLLLLVVLLLLLPLLPLLLLLLPLLLCLPPALTSFPPQRIPLSIPSTARALRH
jgi:hypothetical protein